MAPKKEKREIRQARGRMIAARPPLPQDGKGQYSDISEALREEKESKTSAAGADGLRSRGCGVKTVCGTRISPLDGASPSDRIGQTCSAAQAAGAQEGIRTSEAGQSLPCGKQKGVALGKDKYGVKDGERLCGNLPAGIASQAIFAAQAAGTDAQEAVNAAKEKENFNADVRGQEKADGAVFTGERGGRAGQAQNADASLCAATDAGTSFCGTAENAFDAAESEVFFERVQKLLTDDAFIALYVVGNPKIESAVVTAYLKERRRGVPVMGSGSAVLSPVERPKTLLEAKKLCEAFLKNGR